MGISTLKMKGWGKYVKKLLAVLLVSMLSLILAQPAVAESKSEAQYFLATGRWDNTVIVIDLEKAIDPANDATDNAVVNRLRVTPDIDPDGDGKTEPASGQPIYVTINQRTMRAYISNHSGNVPAADTGNAELGWETTGLSSFGQHGQPGTITVVNLNKALDPKNWGTLGAVEAIHSSRGYGVTGTAVSPDGKYLAIAHAEAKLSEDGGYKIHIVDLATNKVVRTVRQAFGQDKAPYPEGTPIFAPDPRFGYYPAPNGLTFSPLGGGTLFAANGGTYDVSVISWPRVMSGSIAPEIGRIPTQTGNFGISTSPDGKYVAVASREDPRDESEGNTVSIIDVEKALTNPAQAEINRILVGSNNPDEPSRPFATAFSPDGKQIVVTNFRTNNITVIDATEAIRGKKATKHISLEMPDPEKPSRPRGVAFSADGAYVAISGAPTKSTPDSGVVWILDTRDWTVKGRVTGIGNETYMIGGFTGPGM